MNFKDYLEEKADVEKLIAKLDSFTSSNKTEAKKVIDQLKKIQDDSDGGVLVDMGKVKKLGVSVDKGDSDILNDFIKGYEKHFKIIT